MEDIWRLDTLGIEVKKNPIYNVVTLNFSKIVQPDIREEVKRAIFMNLHYEAVGTVQRELSAMRKFSGYLKKEHPEINSCIDIDRDILEGFLIHQNTENSSHKSNSDNVIKLRNILEGIGKLYGYSNLDSLFLNTDVPPEIQPEFKNYSDAEIKRLNAKITELDEQIARCLVIHQVKTKTFEKPISAELSKLIQRAHDYTRNNYWETKYIFVDEENSSRPMQYTTIVHKIRGMILKENLLDDEGNLFKFSTHLFRHYYGVKLTDMHLDDWTIARLLGHKRLGSVQHYRKMSNQKMADETRDIRNMMTEILYKTLDGWGEEYEQIRQND